MVLGGCNLFPQAVLPLFIFEPRYRAMLADALEAHRLFCVAMQRPDATRESPCPIAGLGLIRASVKNGNGTSNLILQGFTRVKLGKLVQSKPYRVHMIEPLESSATDGLATDALVARTLELVGDRLRLGSRLPLEVFRQLAGDLGPGPASVEHCVGALQRIEQPGILADLVTTLLLSDALQRQVILESVEVEDRLKHLVQFLSAEVSRAQKGSTP